MPSGGKRPGSRPAGHWSGCRDQPCHPAARPRHARPLPARQGHPPPAQDPRRRRTCPPVTNASPSSNGGPGRRAARSKTWPNAVIVRGYAAWYHLRRLRRESERHHITAEQAKMTTGGRWSAACSTTTATPSRPGRPACSCCSTDSPWPASPASPATRSPAPVPGPAAPRHHTTGTARTPGRARPPAPQPPPRAARHPHQHRGSLGRTSAHSPAAYAAQVSRRGPVAAF